MTIQTSESIFITVNSSMRYNQKSKLRSFRASLALISVAKVSQLLQLFVTGNRTQTSAVFSWCSDLPFDCLTWWNRRYCERFPALWKVSARNKNHSYFNRFFGYSTCQRSYCWPIRIMSAIAFIKCRSQHIIAISLNSNVIRG